MIFFHLILHPSFPIYDFHIFHIFHFHGLIRNQLNDLPPVGLLAQLVISRAHLISLLVRGCVLHDNRWQVPVKTFVTCAWFQKQDIDLGGSPFFRWSVLKKIVTLIQGRTSDKEVNGVQIRLLKLINTFNECLKIRWKTAHFCILDFFF